MAVDWFLEAKKAHAEAHALQEELHRVRGLWYGACAARTEMRMRLAEVEANERHATRSWIAASERVEALERELRGRGDA